LQTSQAYGVQHTMAEALSHTAHGVHRGDVAPGDQNCGHGTPPRGVKYTPPGFDLSGGPLVDC
jgi:hypothetical protein